MGSPGTVQSLLEILSLSLSVPPNTPPQINKLYNEKIFKKEGNLSMLPWMNIQDVMLSEISQSQKDTPNRIPLT